MWLGSPCTSNCRHSRRSGRFKNDSKSHAWRMQNRYLECVAKRAQPPNPTPANATPADATPADARLVRAASPNKEGLHGKGVAEQAGVHVFLLVVPGVVARLVVLVVGGVRAVGPLDGEAGGAVVVVRALVVPLNLVTVLRVPLDAAVPVSFF